MGCSVGRGRGVLSDGGSVGEGGSWREDGRRRVGKGLERMRLERTGLGRMGLGCKL